MPTRSTRVPSPRRASVLPGVRARSRDHRADTRAPLTKRIEEVAVGDLVWAWDERAGKLGKRRVERLFRHTRKAILDVHCTGGSGAMETIQATAEHPFWVESRGWVAACDLRAGDRLKSVRAIGTRSVAAVVNRGHLADVFNFEVREAHNYFVGRSGILVHNASYDPWPGLPKKGVGSIGRSGELVQAKVVMRDASAPALRLGPELGRGNFKIVHAALDDPRYAIGVAVPEDIIRRTPVARSFLDVHPPELVTSIYLDGIKEQFRAAATARAVLGPIVVRPEYVDLVSYKRLNSEATFTTAALVMERVPGRPDGRGPIDARDVLDYLDDTGEKYHPDLRPGAARDFRWLLGVLKQQRIDIVDLQGPIDGESDAWRISDLVAIKRFGEDPRADLRNRKDQGRMERLIDAAEAHPGPVTIVAPPPAGWPVKKE